MLMVWSTIHLTYADGVEYNTKHRGVIVIAPSEDTKTAIDLICRMTSLVEEAMMQDRAMKRDIIRKMDLDPTDPLLSTRAALNIGGGNQSYLSIVTDLLYDKVTKYCWDYASGKANDHVNNAMGNK